MPTLVAMTAASLALRVCPANAQPQAVHPALRQRGPGPGLSDIPVVLYPEPWAVKGEALKSTSFWTRTWPKGSESQVKDCDRLNKLGSFDLTQLLLMEDRLYVPDTV